MAQGAAGSRWRVFAILQISGALGLTSRNPAHVISAEGPAQPARSGEISLWTQAAPHLDRWYNDVPGANLSTPYDLASTDASGDIHEYQSTSFLPVDGLLSASEGNSHNHHFTLALNTGLTYQPGQVFNFTDDHVCRHQ